VIQSLLRFERLVEECLYYSEHRVSCVSCVSRKQVSGEFVVCERDRKVAEPEAFDERQRTDGFERVADG